MRTTITFADDVAAAVEQKRRERGVGVSEVGNDLIRGALAHPPAPRAPFVQRTRSLGLRIDVTDIADALEQAEGRSWR